MSSFSAETIYVGGYVMSPARFKGPILLLAYLLRS